MNTEKFNDRYHVNDWVEFSNCGKLTIDLVCYVVDKEGYDYLSDVYLVTRGHGTVWAEHVLASRRVPTGLDLVVGTVTYRCLRCHTAVAELGVDECHVCRGREVVGSSE